MGYQHEHDKTPVQDVHVYPWHRPTGCMVTITVRAINRLERLHAVSLPLSLFKLERKKQVVIVICQRLTWALGMILVSK